MSSTINDLRIEISQELDDMVGRSFDVTFKLRSPHRHFMTLLQVLGQGRKIRQLYTTIVSFQRNHQHRTYIAKRSADAGTRRQREAQRHCGMSPCAVRCKARSPVIDGQGCWVQCVTMPASAVTAAVGSSWMNCFH